MILLDTHIWIWWIHGDNRLTKEYTELLQLHEKFRRVDKPSASTQVFVKKKAS